MPAVRVFGFLLMPPAGLHEGDYLWASGPIELDGKNPVTFPVQPSDRATMVVVEVDDGAAVRYELNPNGNGAINARVASERSPKLTGRHRFQWSNGAQIVFVDADAV